MNRRHFFGALAVTPPVLVSLHKGDQLATAQQAVDEAVKRLLPGLKRMCEAAEKIVAAIKSDVRSLEAGSHTVVAGRTRDNASDSGSVTVGGGPASSERLGWAWRGRAWRGKARLGTARQGKAWEHKRRSG